jgi:hypothetical protein
MLFDLIRFVFPTHKFLACLPLVALWSQRKSCIDSIALPHKFSRQQLTIFLEWIHGRVKENTQFWPGATSAVMGRKVAGIVHPDRFYLTLQADSLDGRVPNCQMETEQSPFLTGRRLE